MLEEFQEEFLMEKIQYFLLNKYFRVAFKPVSTIGKPQYTCDFDGV